LPLEVVASFLPASPSTPSSTAILITKSKISIQFSELHLNAIKSIDQQLRNQARKVGPVASYEYIKSIKAVIHEKVCMDIMRNSKATSSLEISNSIRIS
jgi:hypothetical protein